MALSITPLGVVIGATGTRTDVPVLADLASAAGIFAGAAHLAALTALAAGAGIVAVIGTAAVVNARLLLYSAAIEPRFRGQPRWFRWIGPALLIDQTYLVASNRTDLDDPGRFRRFWLVAGLLLMGWWLASVGTGALLGPLLPSGPLLDAAAPVVLAGMIVPKLVAPRVTAIALTGLVVAVLTASLPGGVGVLAGVAAGVAVGAALDRRAA